MGLAYYRNMFSEYAEVLIAVSLMRGRVLCRVSLSSQAGHA